MVKVSADLTDEQHAKLKGLNLTLAENIRRSVDLYLETVNDNDEKLKKEREYLLKRITEIDTTLKKMEELKKITIEEEVKNKHLENAFLTFKTEIDRRLEKEPLNQCLANTRFLSYYGQKLGLNNAELKTFLMLKYQK